MAPLKITSAQMVAEARSRIEELTCETAIALHRSGSGSGSGSGAGTGTGSGTGEGTAAGSAAEAEESAADVVFVDLRDVRERQRAGYIPGSFHCPRGMLEFWVDPDSPYFKPVFAVEDTQFLFYCASGWRSALSVAVLQDMGFKAAHLRDGFSGWAKAGGPVEMPEVDPEHQP